MLNSQIFIFVFGIIIGAVIMRVMMQSKSWKSERFKFQYEIYTHLIKLLLDAEDELEKISSDFTQIEQAVYNEKLSTLNRYAMENLALFPANLTRCIQIITQTPQSKESLLDAYIEIVYTIRKELKIEYEFK